MTTVKQLLERQRGGVYSIAPDTTVYEAIKKMAEKEVGALLVMQDGRLVGIMSERDYTRKVILKGRSSRTTPVREVMTEKVLYVGPDQSVEQCMALMNEHHIRHLPVLDGDTVAGVLSIRDLIQSVIAEQEIVIQQLERYITGGR